MVRFLETLIYEKSGAVCEKKWCGYREKKKKMALFLEILIGEKSGAVIEKKQKREERKWCERCF